MVCGRIFNDSSELIRIVLQHSNVWQTPTGGDKDSTHWWVFQPQTTHTLSGGGGHGLRRMLSLDIHCFGEISAIGVSVNFPDTAVLTNFFSHLGCQNQQKFKSLILCIAFFSQPADTLIWGTKPDLEWRTLKFITLIDASTPAHLHLCSKWMRSNAHKMKSLFCM